MFFNTQSRSTAIDTSLNATLASSSALPGLSTGNPLDSSSAISQSQRMIGASQSLPSRAPLQVPEPAVVTRAPIPALGQVTRGENLVPSQSLPSRAPLQVPEPAVVTRAPIPASTSNSFTFALAADPGSTPGTALDLGYVRANSPRTVNDSVSSIDINDFYRFTVDTDSNLTLRLSGLSADADVEIIRDSNYNGVVDPGEVITRSDRGGSSEEVIDLRGLAGRYYTRVLSYNGTNNTNYTLSLSAGGGAFGTAPEPNNSSSQAYDIGTLNGNRNFSGFVSSTSDLSDFYRFNLGKTSNFRLVLSGLSQDADVEVILDSNGNNVIDSSDEVIGQGRLSGSSRESIDRQNLAAGNYFARVYAYGTTNATNYNLFLLGQPT